MTPDDRRASAERVANEPFFKAFLKEERERALAALRSAGTHDELLKAQARAKLIEDFADDLRRASRRPKGE